MKQRITGVFGPSCECAHCSLVIIKLCSLSRLNSVQKTEREKALCVFFCQVFVAFLQIVFLFSAENCDSWGYSAVYIGGDNMKENNWRPGDWKGDAVPACSHVPWHNLVWRARIHGSVWNNSGARVVRREKIECKGPCRRGRCHSRLRSRSPNILQVQHRPMNRDMLHYLGKAGPLFVFECRHEVLLTVVCFWTKNHEDSQRKVDRSLWFDWTWLSRCRCGISIRFSRA
jgi:hypothetical protein